MVSSNGTIPLRPSCDIWRTWIFALRHGQESGLWLRPPNLARNVATKLLNPGNGCSGAEMQNFLYRCSDREDPKFTAGFFFIFCISQGMPESKQCRSIFWTTLVYTWNYKSFAARAKNCLTVMVWGRQQLVAGRGPAWEPSVSQGHPGITAYRSQLALLSWVPGNQKHENTAAALKNTRFHFTISFKIFLPPCLLMDLPVTKEDYKSILSVRKYYN